MRIKTFLRILDRLAFGYLVARFANGVIFGSVEVIKVIKGANL